MTGLLDWQRWLAGHHQGNLRTSGGPEGTRGDQRHHCPTWLTLPACQSVCVTMSLVLHFTGSLNVNLNDGGGFYMTIFPGLELLGFIGCIILLCPEQENCIKCFCWRFRVCFTTPGRLLGWLAYNTQTLWAPQELSLISRDFTARLKVQF